jgi:tRNA pseudouridine32 synthase / 23S rRNA pseudouridine746 synthase
MESRPVVPIAAVAPTALRNGVARSKLVLPSGPWVLLIDYLAARFKHIERDEHHARLIRGEYTDAHNKAYGISAPYIANSVVLYFRDVPVEAVVPLKEEILFQDDEILVADKPPFLTVIPAGQHLQETLLVRLRKRTGLANLVPMHRIDRETSGLVLFTLNPKTRGKYQSMFEAKTIEKTYEAIAPANPQFASPMRYESRIEESPAFMQMHEVAGMPNAATYIERIQVVGDMAKYRVKPETGKKHQIRIHFCALGMPILNDQIYPVLLPVGQDDYAKPLQLLAKEIRFIDPITNGIRHFVSPRILGY